MDPCPDLIAIGALHWDVIGRAPLRMAAGADVPGVVTRGPGGVAMNVAAALAVRGLAPALLAAIGEDAEGEALADGARALGVDTRFLFRIPGRASDRYLAIEAAGRLVGAIADARTLEAAGVQILAPLAEGRLGACFEGTAVIDGNLPPQVLADLAQGPLLAEAELRLVPASPEKAARFRPFLGRSRTVFHLNRAEAAALAGCAFPGSVEAAAGLVGLGAARVLVTDGPRRAAEAGTHGARAAVPPRVPVLRVTGAGDAFLAGHLATERSGASPDDAFAAALDAASAHISAEAPT